MKLSTTDPYAPARPDTHTNAIRQSFTSAECRFSEANR